MSVRLRAHHLLCLLTYVGKGYTPAFVTHYDKVVARLNAGEDALLVEGPDDICAPMLEGGHHCRESRIAARDARAVAAVGGLLGRRLQAGDAVPLDRGWVTRMREAFARGTLRSACASCQWSEVCTEVADGNFPATRFTGG